MEIEFKVKPAWHVKMKEGALYLDAESKLFRFRSLAEVGSYAMTEETVMAAPT